MKNKVKTKSAIKIIPKIALKLGEKSASAACSWWYNQPKVPELLKEKSTRKSNNN